MREPRQRLLIEKPGCLFFQGTHELDVFRQGLLLQEYIPYGHFVTHQKMILTLLFVLISATASVSKENKAIANKDSKEEETIDQDLLFEFFKKNILTEANRNEVSFGGSFGSVFGDFGAGNANNIQKNTAVNVKNNQAANPSEGENLKLDKTSNQVEEKMQANNDNQYKKGGDKKGKEDGKEGEEKKEGGRKEEKKGGKEGDDKRKEPVDAYSENDSKKGEEKERGEKGDDKGKGPVDAHSENAGKEGEEKKGGEVGDYKRKESVNAHSENGEKKIEEEGCTAFRVLIWILFVSLFVLIVGFVAWRLFIRKRQAIF